MTKNLPKNYMNIREKFEEYGNVLAELGKVANDAGPIDKKTQHLIKLAVSTADKSEGGVHSHTRRALENGASADEIYQTLILITSIVGFPTVAASMTWVNDIIEG
jgi:AhpD family alkylhydroperoxidase